jgi:hypothetical protein
LSQTLTAVRLAGTTRTSAHAFGIDGTEIKMDDENFAGLLLRETVTEHGAGIDVRGPREAQLRESNPVVGSVSKYGALTPCEAKFVTALLDRMLRLGAGPGNQMDIREEIYFDIAIAGAWVSAEGPGIQSRRRDVDADAGSQWDCSWTTLCRVGMAVTQMYCVTAFGRSFDDIPAVDKEKGLSLLDRIKFVFADGSQAGVIFTAVYRWLKESPHNQINPS